MHDTMIVRFAPSPTGRLHIGNIRTALYNHLLALKSQGQFVLRLDDTDTERSTREYADLIVEDLEWLGIVPDRVAQQSDRMEAYDASADRLRELGLLYPCFESAEEIERRRKRLMARGLPPIYDRSALKLSEEEREALLQQGKKPHWRFLLPNFDKSPFEPTRTEIVFDDIMRGPQTVDLASMSDPVLIRADGTYLYTLPSVVDDIDMGITHVVRGADHIANTGTQIALSRALGGREPFYGHHNLLQDAEGAGLSKRSGSLSIGGLREEGFLPMAVASLATLIGTGQPVEACSSLKELAEHIDFEGISKSNAKFDLQELRSVNRTLVHTMTYDEARPILQRLNADLGEMFWLAVRDNLETFNDVTIWRDVVTGDFEGAQFEADDKAFFAEAQEMLPGEPWSDETWPDWTLAIREKTERRGKALFLPLRRALTGLEYGPDLKFLLPVIGRAETLRRLS